MKTAIATVLVLVVSSAVVIASSVAAPTATGRINVTATLTRMTARPLAPPGRQSNASEQAWRVTDRYGRRVGRMLLACRWILPRSRYCDGVVVMPRGVVSVSGTSPTEFEGEYAVTGGTGAYRGAGGAMVWIAIGLRKQVLLITIDP